MQLKQSETFANPIAQIIFLYLYPNEMVSHNMDFLPDGTFFVAL